MPKAYQMKPFGENQLRLPSLEEFDQGVEALARSYGPPQAAGSSMRPMEGLMQGLAPSRPLPEARFGSLDSFSLHQQSAPMVHPSHSMDGYPSPPPESEGRHINQKYTTEEGDFIIYAWHDKRMRWHTIKDHFAAMFGRTPERTVQGLQAWYYRMNQKIPVWDQDGWLCFENEDDLEPKYVSIKCRDRDSREKPSAPLGLAQRYPERAIAYPWVDPEIRGKAQDWGEFVLVKPRAPRLALMLATGHLCFVFSPSSLPLFLSLNRRC